MKLLINFKDNAVHVNNLIGSKGLTNLDNFYMPINIKSSLILKITEIKTIEPNHNVKSLKES